MSAPTTTRSFEWIIYSVIGLICVVLCSILLRKEYRRRRDNNVLFASQPIRQFPIACMVSGLLLSLNASLYFLPGICYFSYHLNFILLCLQIVLMGFYQLSRLHYCFAQEKCYSKHGYSKWMFRGMYFVGMAVIAFALIGVWFVAEVEKCKIASDLSFHYIFTQKVLSKGNATLSDLWKYLVPSTVGLYCCWDFATMALYIYKCKLLRKVNFEHATVRKRIECILMKIILLTVLYEIVFAAIFLFDYSELIRNDHDFAWPLFSVTVNYCMFLMQEHNREHYAAFLQRLCMHKIICCRKYVAEELASSKHVNGETGTKKPDHRSSVSETPYSTNDLSTNHGAATITQQYVENMKIINQPSAPYLYNH